MYRRNKRILQKEREGEREEEIIFILSVYKYKVYVYDCAIFSCIQHNNIDYFILFSIILIFKPCTY
jgi:hypothetical protein